MARDKHNLTPPAVGTSWERTFRLDRNSEKMALGNPLVKMSANCDVVGTVALEQIRQRRDRERNIDRSPHA